jgi:hypothetical protein
MDVAEAVGKVDIEGLARSMRQTGFGVVEEFLPSADLQDMRSLVRAAVAQRGNQYAYLAGDALAGTIIDDLARSDRMLALLAGLYEEAVGAPPSPEATIHPALRCLLGNSGAKESLRFHYDSYMVTALLPIEIPTLGNRGDLLHYPNRRPVRRSALVNVVEKIAVQNPASRRLLASRAFRSALPPQRQELEPGNLYVFWGYRSLHGNDRCDVDRLRATALFHFGDPHTDDRLVQVIQRRVQRRTGQSGSTS